MRIASSSHIALLRSLTGCSPSDYPDGPSFWFHDYSVPGDLRFPNFSDVTTKLRKHVRDQFHSRDPLLDSRVTNQVAPENEN